MPYAYVAPHIKCDVHALFPLADCIQTMSANLCGDVVSQAEAISTIKATRRDPGEDEGGGEAKEARMEGKAYTGG